MEQSLAEIVIVKLFVAYMVIVALNIPSQEPNVDEVFRISTDRSVRIDMVCGENVFSRSGGSLPIGIYYGVGSVLSESNADLQNCAYAICDTMIDESYSDKDSIEEIRIIGYASKSWSGPLYPECNGSTETCNYLLSEARAREMYSICKDAYRRTEYSLQDPSWFDRNVFWTAKGAFHDGEPSDDSYQRVEFQVIRS